MYQKFLLALTVNRRSRASYFGRMGRAELTAGFTLIEMLVSVAIFMFVMVIAVGSLVAIVGADRKAQSIEAVVDNLRFAIDDMSRTVRTGTDYFCGSSGAAMNTRSDCQQSGGSQIFVTDQYGRRVSFKWGKTTIDCGSAAYTGGCLLRSVYDPRTLTQTPLQPITSSEIAINNITFYVVGSTPGTIPQGGDSIQPKILIVVSASVTHNLPKPTTLNLESTVTQRNYDN